MANIHVADDGENYCIPKKIDLPLKHTHHTELPGLESLNLVRKGKKCIKNHRINRGEF